MVLLHLVSGGAGALLRSKCAVVADLAGLEFYHRHCLVHQHGHRGHDPRETGALAGDPTFFDAILCLEFFRLGERKRLCANFFAQAGRVARGGVMRNALRDGVFVETACRHDAKPLNS